MKNKRQNTVIFAFIGLLVIAFAFPLNAQAQAPQTENKYNDDFHSFIINRLKQTVQQREKQMNKKVPVSQGGASTVAMAVLRLWRRLTAASLKQSNFVAGSDVLGLFWRRPGKTSPNQGIFFSIGEILGLFWRSLTESARTLAHGKNENGHFSASCRWDPRTHCFAARPH